MERSNFQYGKLIIEQLSARVVRPLVNRSVESLSTGVAIKKYEKHTWCSVNKRSKRLTNIIT